MNKNKISLKVKNPLIDKLNIERSLLSAEVKNLNKDLLFIKQLIRNKQNDLSELNDLLINKTLRGPFLSVVPSNSKAIDRDGNREFFDVRDSRMELTCLIGGKDKAITI